MTYNGFAIDNYLDAEKVTKQLKIILIKNALNLKL